MDKHQALASYIANNPDKTGKVVDYDPVNDRLLQLDLTADNSELHPSDVADTKRFTNWLE